MVAIRAVRPDEEDALGALTLVAYRSLDGPPLSGSYEADLADVTHRVAHAVVLVAVDEGDCSLGGVTNVADSASALAEWDEPEVAGIRMLAVAADAERRGVGEALTVACIERARAQGARSLVLHSTPWMATAHRLSDRLGFRRAPELDSVPEPEVPLLGFRLVL